MVYEDKETLVMSMQMQRCTNSLSAHRFCALSFHSLAAPRLTVVMVSISLSLSVFNRYFSFWVKFLSIVIVKIISHMETAKKEICLCYIVPISRCTFSVTSGAFLFLNR